MTCNHIVGRIDEYLDGKLPAAEHEAVRRHLEGCDECRGELEAIRQLRAEAQALPGSVEPPRDLWPQIATRLKAAKVVRPRFGQRLRSATWSQLMGAAAVVVMAVALILGYWLGSGPEAPRVAEQPASLATAARSALTALGEGDLDLTKARQELLAVFDARSDSLSPQAVAAIKDGLGAIDDSVAGIRAALEKNPGDPRLTRLLANARRQEIQLLQRAATLPGEM